MYGLPTAETKALREATGSSIMIVPFEQGSEAEAGYPYERSGLKKTNLT
jgi:hypothetical protein